MDIKSERNGRKEKTYGRKITNLKACAKYCNGDK